MKRIILGLVFSVVSLTASAHVTDFFFNVKGSELAGFSVEAKAEYTALNCKEINFRPIMEYVPILIPQRENKILESQRISKTMSSSGELQFHFKNSGKEKCDYYVSSVSVNLKNKKNRSQFFIVYSDSTLTDTRPMVLDLVKYTAPGSYMGNTYSRVFDTQGFETEFTFDFLGSF